MDRCHLIFGSCTSLRASIGVSEVLLFIFCSKHTSFLTNSRVCVCVCVCVCVQDGIYVLEICSDLRPSLPQASEAQMRAVSMAF